MCARYCCKKLLWSISKGSLDSFLNQAGRCLMFRTGGRVRSGRRNRVVQREVRCRGRRIGITTPGGEPSEDGRSDRHPAPPAAGQGGAPDRSSPVSSRSSIAERGP
jgi:hypothetical protein